MHRPIRDYLEVYLKDPRDHAIPSEFHTHLAVCESCAQTLETLSTQASQLRFLSADAAAEPRPGFYARVVNRIDAERDSTMTSFWSPFLVPGFGRRVVIASGVLVLALGTYLISTEPGDTNVMPSLAVTQEHTMQTTDGAVRPQDRDAVLVNLASYHE